MFIYSKTSCCLCSMCMCKYYSRSYFTVLGENKYETIIQLKCEHFGPKHTQSTHTHTPQKENKNPMNVYC